MEYLLVTPVTLRSHWPQICESLEAVQAKSPEDWLKEDVYFAIKAGHASCHMAMDGGAFAGLMVVTRSVTEFSGSPSLHVWIAHSVGAQDVVESGVTILREMAKAGGFPRITFGSSRAGWGRRFKLVSATYEIDVNGDN